MSNYSQKGQQAPEPQQVEKLPQVGPEQLGDRLASAAWGEHLKSQTPDPAVSGAADMHRNLVTGVQAAIRQRENQNPNHTQSQHLETLSKSYDSFLMRSTNAVLRQRDQLKNRLSEIEMEAKRELDFKGSNAAELRSVLREAGTENRQQIIQDAINSKDGELLAAVLDAHPSLSGVTAEQREGYRVQALSKHAPELLKTEKAIRQADELLRDSFDDALGLADRLTAKQLRDKYKAQQEAAQAASREAEETWASLTI